MRHRNPTAQYNETLNPRVRQWILTMLVPLGGMYSYESYQIVNDSLLQALFNFDDPELDLSKAELQAMLRTEYRRDCAQKAHLPEVLQSNVAELAKLVSLDSIERSILEFAVALSMDTRLSSASVLLGDINTAKLFYSLATLLNHSESEIRTALSRDGTLMRTGIFNLRNFEQMSLTSKLEILSVSFADPQNSHPMQSDAVSYHKFATARTICVKRLFYLRKTDLQS